MVWLNRSYAHSIHSILPLFVNKALSKLSCFLSFWFSSQSWKKRPKLRLRLVWPKSARAPAVLRPPALRRTALLDIRSVLSCRFCFSKLPHPTYTRPSLLNVIVTFLYIWYFRELFGKDELKFHQFEGWYATSGSEIIN